MDDLSEGQAERFHQEIMETERLCQGQKSHVMMGDHTWGLLHENHLEF